MVLEFHHGITVHEIDDGLRPLTLNDQGIVGIIGTAPDADPSVFPLDTPVLLYANPRKAVDLDPFKQGNGTLYEAVNLLYKQTGSRVIVVRVEEGADDIETRANLLGSPIDKSGLWAFLKCKSLLNVKPKIIIAPGWTEERVTDGLLDFVMTEQGAGYTEPPAVTITPETGNTPSIPARATALMGVGADAGKVVEIRIDQAGEGYTAASGGPTVTIADAPAGGTTATATVSVGDARNPVVAEALGLAERIRAIVYADAPGTTDAAAVTYRGDWGSKRLEIFEPRVLVYDAETNSHVPYPMSVVAAGVRARITKERGFWWSKSNKEVYGITGVSRAIDFNIADPSTQANYLNENELTTVVRHLGYRLWGNRTVSADQSWAFEVHRLVADAVYDVLEDSFLWAVDRPMNANNIEEIVERVKSFMRYLEAEEAILGGDAWIDPTINTKDQLAQGILSVDIALEGPPPIEHLRFRAHRNPDAYDNLVSDVLIRIENL